MQGSEYCRRRQPEAVISRTNELVKQNCVRERERADENERQSEKVHNNFAAVFSILIGNKPLTALACEVSTRICTSAYVNVSIVKSSASEALLDMY